MPESRCWTWRSAVTQSGLPATTRHVLHVISFHMNEHGAGSYPSQETIAEETGYSRKSVNEHITKAVDSGWLKVQQHGFGGRKWRRNEYIASWPERDVDGTQIEAGGSNGGLQPHVDEVVTLTAQGCNPDGVKVVTEGYTNPPINPPKNSPARERAREPETGSERVVKGSGLGKTQRRKLIDKAIEEWPKRTGSIKQAMIELEKLDDDDLQAAVAKIPVWLAEQKRLARDYLHALSTYAKDRLFDQIELPTEPPPPTTTYALPGGQMWFSRFYQILIEPMAKLPPPATDYLRRQIEAPDKAGQIARMQHQAKHGWPKATAMLQEADSNRGVSVSLDLKPLGERFQNVLVDGELWNAFKAEHERRGWPWLDRHSGGAWLPVPAGDVAGMAADEIVARALEEFQVAIAAITQDEEKPNDDCGA